jgi:hypothetical protein
VLKLLLSGKSCSLGKGSEPFRGEVREGSNIEARKVLHRHDDMIFPKEHCGRCEGETTSEPTHLPQERSEKFLRSLGKDLPKSWKEAEQGFTVCQGAESVDEVVSSGGVPPSFEKTRCALVGDEQIGTVEIHEAGESKRGHGTPPRGMARIRARGTSALHRLETSSAFLWKIFLPSSLPHESLFERRHKEDKMALGQMFRGGFVGFGRKTVMWPWNKRKWCERGMRGGGTGVGNEERRGLFGRNL